MALSDAACKYLKPKEKPYKKSDSLGLFLLIKPTGKKFWRMKYHFFGKEKSLSIGEYPEVTLAEAREKRDKARKLVKEGTDPSLYKQEQKRLLAISHANTFEAVAREWHQKNINGWSENHAKTVMRRLEKDLFPTVGKLPIKDISTPRLTMVIEDIEKRGAYDVARRCLQMSRAIFAYAKIKGKIQDNPADIKASDFLAPYKKTHYASMELSELPMFLKKLNSNQARMYRETQLALYLMLLTFVRTGELIKAKWEEFDLEKAKWDIPEHRMKMKKNHIVPLAKQTIRILEELKLLNPNREYLFPSRTNPKKHMSNNTILAALRRMGYEGIHTGHGFRALAMSSIMEELDYSYEVVDVQLAHGKKGDVRAAYDRAKYLKQRIKMMQDWADYIDKLKI